MLMFLHKIYKAEDGYLEPFTYFIINCNDHKNFYDFFQDVVDAFLRGVYNRFNRDDVAEKNKMKQLQENRLLVKKKYLYNSRKSTRSRKQKMGC